MPSDLFVTAAAHEEIEEAATVDAEDSGVMEEHEDTDAAGSGLVDHVDADSR
jgi:hypothetical protein